ncbi:ABC transporter substrate-binding protein [Glaciecola sp. KUL10]|uniref:substrate-binding periplasmic protein n=1 Tax=Glaciecola sp. (strain KUL10) TaxID=2161813 RepID=UPI000D78C887|nr:ABC transporter substrate-binding protein [Glaciecola sp. KUL10]GBL03923.1 hypothetical protein KUL10_12240 [Glaciecola sp. KUL10]
MKLIKNLCVFTAILVSGAGLEAYSQELKLVGNKVESYINDHNLPARQIDIVKAALSDVELEVTATTQAWYGSGLRNGTYNGFIDHYSLNAKKDEYLYSKPYITFELHLGAKTPGIKEIALLDQLGRARVGIETRFANTDTVRGERSVSWARSQVFYENIRQFADKRVDFILADKDMIMQFNNLLSLKNEELIYLSNEPMYVVEVSLGLSKSVQNAASIINQFNQNIDNLKASGEYQKLLTGDTSKDSLLNPVVYEDILRKW